MPTITFKYYKNDEEHTYETTWENLRAKWRSMINRINDTDRNFVRWIIINSSLFGHLRMNRHNTDFHPLGGNRNLFYDNIRVLQSDMVPMDDTVMY